jgi:predicted lactoylglutathione lyase
MTTKAFVNIAVKDLERSKDFFSRLGYSFNPKFAAETAACLVTSRDIYAMLKLRFHPEPGACSA